MNGWGKLRKVPGTPYAGTLLYRQPEFLSKVCRVQEAGQVRAIRDTQDCGEGDQDGGDGLHGSGGLSCRGGGWDGKSSSFYGHLKLGPSSL